MGPERVNGEGRGSSNSNLKPFPFSHEPGFFTDRGDEGWKDRYPEVVLPPLIQNSDGKYIKPRSDIRRFLRHELDVSRLNKIQNHLWLAGLPRGARPLHRQILLERQILVTEQADLHMVWQKTRFFVKPLPVFLLKREYWLDHICKDERLFQDACGFLVSYAWLVCYESDLQIAHRLGLVPKEMDWIAWTDAIEDLLQHVDLRSPNGINPRYRYGELRLNRLNWIYRSRLLELDFRTFWRGYFRGPDWYSQFIRNNFGWFIIVFAYMTIVLSAMQVGLEVQSLTNNHRFQNASYGFTIFAIAMPVILVGLILIMSAIAVLVSFKSTSEYSRRVATNPGPYVGATEDEK